MKKLASILLLSILLFNWVGYQFYIEIMENRANREMIENLNKNNYSESELISIKVPVTYLYYNEGSTDFVRVDGKVEIEGNQYNYVKRRFINDSLEMLCIPNKEATDLKSARDQFFALVSDLQHSGQTKNTGHHDTAIKSLNSDYYPNSYFFTLDHLLSDLSPATDSYILRIPTVYLNPASQPPDASCYLPFLY